MQTDNVAFAGSYPMDIESTILVPIGLDESPSYDPWEIRISLTLKVVNPCLSTVLDSITVRDMSTTVLGPADLQDLTLQIPTDTVSFTLGTIQNGLTYCGERSFRFTTPTTTYENFLSYNDLTHIVTLLSSDDSDIGTNIPITIEAYLVSYPTITSPASFTVTIGGCIVTTFEA